MDCGRFIDFQRADSILKRALGQPPETRQAFLLDACGSDRELLVRVRDLLALAVEDADALAPGRGLQAALASTEKEASAGLATVGERFGPWRIVDEIGRGGMAVVYRAERADGAYRQQVAIKLLHRSSGSGSIEQRFERERRLLARLAHPNIARLLDGGTTEDGRAYIVMEYVEGETIDRWCDTRQLSIEARLKLFLAVCDAVQFAHRQLIVHRDIKPTNIIVTPDGVPKLLDFGIAKLLEADNDFDDLTRTGVADRMLTPQYSSPEQVLGEPVSIVTDVHALGLLLYELLSGHRARKIASTRPSEIEKAVCETQPAMPSLVCASAVALDTNGGAVSPEQIAAARGLSPSRLKRALRGDLDNIVMMALRRKPERRYATAEQMADDICGFLAKRPVRARADSPLYRLDRFVRRHSSGFAMAIAVIVLTLATASYYTIQLTRERDIAAQAAETARIEANRAERVTEFLVELFRSAEPDRPADRLPDTEELLQTGARSAMNDSSAPPEVRLRMLEIIGQVYVERNRFDQARPLLEEAVELARRFQPERPEALADALMDRAYLSWKGQTPGDAENDLLEAEGLVAGNEKHLELWVRAIMDRSWVASLQRDHRRAVEILQPLYERVRARSDLDPGTLYRVIERLSSLQQQLGNLEAASRLRAESEPLLLEAHGSESRTYAIHLANTSNLEHMLGRFEVARRLNREALQLYDRIYLDRPAPFRAVARRNLVRKLLTVGRFDQALVELEKSTGELARAFGIKRDQHASHHYYHGEMLLMMRRWGDAVRHLEQARLLYARSDDISDYWLTSTDALLVWAMCRQGLSDNVMARYVGLESRLAQPLSMGGRAEARIRSARACMQWRSGSLDRALGEIDKALSLVSDLGSLLVRSERMVMRALILESMGKVEAARAQFESAVRLFAVNGLADHPNASESGGIGSELNAISEAAK